MTAHDLYLEAAKLGLRLEPAGDKLAIRPKGKCPPDFAEVLRRHKSELLNWLSRPRCPGWQAVPPEDLPLAPLLHCPASRDRERVIGYLLRQTGTVSGNLTAWLVRRENAYYEWPGRTWDCALIAYASARDAACWQLQRCETELYRFLASFEESHED
jgi:hypothetical protein